MASALRLAVAGLLAAVLMTALPAHADTANEDPLQAAIASASAIITSHPHPSRLTEALVRRGEARRLSGQLHLALQDLQQATEVAPTDRERAYALVALGIARAQANQRRKARTDLTDALALMGASPNAALTAVAAAELARLARPEGSSALFVRAQKAKAMGWAQRAQTAAAGLPPGPIRARADLAAADIGLVAADEAGRSQAKGWLAAGLNNLDVTPPGISRDQMLVQAGRLALTHDMPDLAERAFAAAATSRSVRIRSAAAEGRARLALAAGHDRAAIVAADEALRLAQQTGDAELAFRAAWRSGQALAASGDRVGALTAYRLAFANLRTARGDLRDTADTGQPLFRREYGAFHHAYFDLLLQLSDAGGDPSLLSEARSVIEDLKADEVDDYFQERCVPRGGSGVPVGEAGEGVAVLYPVVLPDRLELLLEVGGSLTRTTVPIPQSALEPLVRGYRRAIQDEQLDYRQRGPALYRVLIAPIADQLAAQHVHTIVYSPDSVLRLVPLAALWDDQQFLVERFAVATVLGLTFVPSQSAVPSESLALAAGATQVKGYAPLPSVEAELQTLAERMPTDRLFQADFSTGKFAAALQNRPYDLIHVASHAEVGPRPDDNFIAAVDGRIDMNELALRLRARSLVTDRPLELMTLSACSTAGGDDRAPLGLAGIAFRAGARSVVASLWPVRDVATPVIMNAMYSALAEGATRSEALARAQVQMIRTGGVDADPAIWAAFLSIGDWR